MGTTSVGLTFILPVYYVPMEKPKISTTILIPLKVIQNMWFCIYYRVCLFFSVSMIQYYGQWKKNLMNLLWQALQKHDQHTVWNEQVVTFSLLKITIWH